MALVLSDRVQETSTSTGTGTITLAGAVTGYQSFAVIGNTNTTYYTIADQAGSNWEVGIGTYYTGNVSLARTTILASSNANAVVTFSAGTKSVFVTYPAEKAVYLDAGNVTTITNFASANVLITGGSISNITIPAANVSGLGTMATQNASSVVITGGTINSVAHTGGTLNNMTIGATTANTGAFTTITTTSPINVASGGTGAATLTGVIKGNGTSAFTAATAGTDYVAPATATTFTALQTFNGTSALGALKTVNINEPATVSATASTGTINFDVTTQSVLYYTTNATGNFTLNFRASSGTSLNTLLATGDSICVSFLCTNGATAYYNSAVQVDGSSVTPKYQGGTAWTAGNASGIDGYNFVIIKTGSAAFTILTSQTQFK